MKRWRAIVPLKAAAESKTRLGCPDAERGMIAERMARHVLVTLAQCARIELVATLSPQPHDGFHWIADSGAGLNAELTAARQAWRDHAVLIVHGDLPKLKAEEVEHLLAAAESDGIALAPDRHGTGTNAVALAECAVLDFAFGVGSFKAHLAAAPNPAIVYAAGLALDIDTPQDLIDAAMNGTLAPDDPVRP